MLDILHRPSPAWTLPRPLRRHLDALADSLFAGPGMPHVDFASPPGAPALVPADSASWRLFRNPVALFIGGIGAVILELAEPHVRDGVWQHSSFRADALTRLRRTGLAAMVTVYGAREKAEAMIANVVRVHGHVTGETSEGDAYAANDPVLLDWVQATATWGFLEATHAYVRPIDRAERNRLYAEGKASARLYGAVGAPESQAEADALHIAMRPVLVPSPIIAEFLGLMLEVEAFPAFGRPLQRMMVKAAVELLPADLRAQLQLGARWSLAGWERALVKAAARAADRLVLRSAPAVQACRRLDLPDDYLYRR